ncbi:MAG: TolC family protein [Alphaproteobacteria bacterium]|nr:TolC family protein [Alphaproteobacteria bacterium]
MKIYFIFPLFLLFGCGSHPQDETRKGVEVSQENKQEEPITSEKKEEVITEEESREKFFLTEETLKDLISKQSPPSLKRIESVALKASLASETLEEKYALMFEGQSEYYNTNENPIFIYAPVVSPIKSSSFGFSKAFSTGMKVGIYNEWEEKKISTFGVHGRNAVAFRFEMDLFKNLFGQQSLSELNNAELESEIAEKEEKIARKTFSISMEKLYWNLVGVEEQLKLLDILIESVEKQTREVKGRYSNGVADAGDLARQEASLATHYAQKLEIEYQRESIREEFKSLIPFLSDKEIVLGDYDLESKQAQVLGLISKITKIKETPLDATFYDEIVLALEKAREEKLDSDSAHSDVDVSFYTEYKHLTDGSDFSTAVSEMQDNAEESYSFGVKVSVPLTSEKRKSERLKKRISSLDYDARKEDIEAKLNAYHFQTKKMFLLLEEFIKKQSEKTKNLEKTVNSTRQKYGQARVQLRDLVEDQNLYLQSAMSEVDIKLMVIQRVLDYLSIFTEMEK